MAQRGCQARTALLAVAGLQIVSGVTLAPKVITKSPLEEFSNTAAQALQSLSSQFTEFHQSVTIRTAKLTEALKQEDRANHAIEAVNAQIVKDVASLRHKNQGLRQKAKVLVEQNEQLRGELHDFQARMHAAEKFTANAIEGSSKDENSDLKAAETPLPTVLPAATPGNKNGVGEVATVSAAGDSVNVQNVQSAGSSASSSLDDATGVPIVQGVKESEDDGYSYAFTAGGDDDGGSIVEQPSPENGFSPDDVQADVQDVGVSLLSLAKARHRRVGHRAKATVEAPNDVLPSTADGFAEYEKNSMASLQRSFEAQLQRAHSRHSRLMQRRSSLNTEKESLEALHSRLASVVAQLEGRHSRLRLRVRSVGDFVHHLATAAREPAEQAEVALRSMQAPPRL